MTPSICDKGCHFLGSSVKSAVGEASKPVETAHQQASPGRGAGFDVGLGDSIELVDGVGERFVVELGEPGFDFLSKGLLLPGRETASTMSRVQDIDEVRRDSVGGSVTFVEHRR